jgi:hypothetical protein
MLSEDEKARKRERNRLALQKKRAEDPEYFRSRDRARKRNGDPGYLASRRAKYAANPEPTRAKMRERYADPEKRAAHLEYCKQRYANDPLLTRRYKLKQEYGITLEQFEAMRDAQGGCCAICEEPFSKTPHVDHCHATGNVRALLCGGCNTGLGRFRDNPEHMEAAARYVRAHRTRLELVKEA